MVSLFLGPSDDGDAVEQEIDNRFGVSLVASPDVDILGQRIVFESAFEVSTTDQYSWALGEDAELFGLNLEGGADANITTSLTLSMQYGLDLSSGTPEFFVQFVDPAVGAIRTDIDGVHLGAKIGDLGLGVDGGKAELNARIEVDFGDLEFRGGQITTANLGAVDVNFGGGFEVVLPVSLKIGSWSLPGLPIITIGVPDLFNNPDIVFTVNSDASALEPFAGITNEGILSLFNQTAGWLGSLSNRAFGVDLLLVGEGLLSDYAHLGAVLNQFLLPEIQDAEGNPTFGTIQELVEIVESKVAGLELGYDEARQAVTLNLSATDRTSVFESTFDPGVNLGDLVVLETDTTVALTAGYDLDLGLALELRQSEAKIVGNTELPSNGRLSNDAVFVVEANNIDPTVVTVPRSTNNLSRQELIDDINEALAAAGVGSVVASLTAENKLQLSGPQTYSVSYLSVTGIADGNSATTNLGLTNGQNQIEDAIDRTWVDQASASANLRLAADPIEAKARFGRVGIELVDGVAEAVVGVSAQVLNPATGLAESVRLTTLIDTLVSQGVGSVADVTLGGTAMLDLTNIRTEGTELPVPGIPGVKYEWADIFQPTQVQTTYNGDFDLLLTARFVALENVLSLLRDVRDWLVDAESSPLLSTSLPVLDKSVSDMIRLSETVDELIRRLEEVGPESLQEIERVIRDYIEEVTGAIADFDPMSLEGPDLRFNFSWLAAVNEQGQASVQNDLANVGFAGQASTVGAGAGATVNIVGQAGYDLTFGLDLTTPVAPVAYIQDDARIFAELLVDGDNVDADLSLGPLGFFVVDGTVDLNNGVDQEGNALPARLEVSLADDPVDGRYNLVEVFSHFEFVSEGNAEAILPMYFPTVSTPVNGNTSDNDSNNLIFRIGDLNDPFGTTSLSGPPLSAFLDNIDFSDDLRALTGDWDSLLALLESALDGELFGIDLPLIGDDLREAGNFIKTIRDAGETELSNLTVYSLAAVHGTFYSILGPSGANVILDREDDADEIVTLDDLEFTISDLDNDGQTDGVQFDVMLGQVSSLVDYQADFDLGLDVLGLEVDGKVNVDTGWQFDLGFGISKQHGIYLDTNPNDSTPEITVGIHADIPGFSATGKLGFLQAEIRDDPNDPTHFDAGLTVDLVDLNGDGRLTLSELRAGGFKSLDRATDFEIGATLDVNLEIETGTTIAALPSFQVDLLVDWMFEALPDTVEGEDAMDRQGLAPTINFSNVRLNLGSFVSDILSPAVGHIDGVLDQIRPVIDVLTEPLPIFDQIYGDDFTIVDLARLYGFEETANFLDAAVTIFAIADSIPQIDGDDVYIDLGSFDFGTFDARSFKKEDGSQAPEVEPQNVTDPTVEPTEQAKQHSGPLAGLLDSLDNLAGGAVSFPILEDPRQAFLMLLGQDVDLVLYDMPAATLEFVANTPPLYLPTPIPVPVYIQFGGFAGAGIDLAFGYDTRGIRQANESGDFGQIFNGLFVDERDSSGRDAFEAFVFGGLEAKAAVGIAGFLSIGVEGGIEMTIGIDLVDPNRDGKVYLDEAGSQIDQHGLACLFEVGGLLEAFLEIEVEVFPLGELEFEIARTTLADFTIHACSSEEVIDDRFEGNNSRNRAAFLGNGPGINVTGTSISSTTDQDWYSFDVHRGDTLDINLSHDSTLTTDLEVYDAQGNLISSSPASASSSTLTIDATPGTYFLYVDGDGQTGAYDISVTPSATSSTSVYYVNAPGVTDPKENSFYTLAPGSATNTGLSPQSPLDSMQAVIDQYDLEPNDIVVVDSGTYGSTVIGAQDSGAWFWGAPGGSSLSGTAATFTIDGADDILLTDFDFTGGTEGVLVQGNSSSYQVTGNTFEALPTAVRVVSDDQGSVYGNDILGDNSTASANIIFNGIVLEQSASTLIYDNEMRDLDLGISSASPDVQVYGNDIVSAELGLSISGQGVIGPVMPATQGPNLVRQSLEGARVAGTGRLVGNTFANNTIGVIATDDARVDRNTINDQLSLGIDATDRVSLRSNRVDDTPTAVRVAGQVSLTDNRISDAEIGVEANLTGAVDGQNYLRNSISGTTIAVELTGVGAITNTTFTENSFADVGTAIKGQGITSLDTFTFERNTVESTEQGVLLPDTTTTNYYLIRGNDVQTSAVGFDINGTPEFVENEVRGSAVAIRAASTVLIGGPDWTTYRSNLIHGNQLGIEGAGEVRFNRIYENAIGLQAYSNTNYHHNLVYRNTDTGILLDGVTGAQIVHNTIDAPQGDGVRLVNGTADTYLRNNIIWTESGTGLFVEPFSHYGLDSDYNNFYATNGGELTHLQLGFDDILDWRIESPYDNHSIGRTDVDPTLDNPLFLDRAGADYQLTPLASTSIDAGDPLLASDLEPGNNGGLANLGAYGNTALASESRAQYIEVVYPEFYTDIEINDGQIIQWRTYDSNEVGLELSGNVDIDLVLSDGTKVLDLGFAPATDKQFVWNVNAGDITPDYDTRYRVQISWVGDTAVSDSTREPFTIVPDTVEFYSDDFTSNEGDQYTPSAVGDNRNTGKLATAPKRSILALFDNYDLNPLDVVYVDAGSNYLLRNLVISGELGVGDDEGVVIQGPGNASAFFDRWDPAAGRYAIDIADGDFVTISGLTISGGEHNIYARNDSNNFNVSNLILQNAGSDGLRLEGPSEFSQASDIQVTGAGSHGIYANVSFPMTRITSHGNTAHGIFLDGAQGSSITESIAYNNGQDGIRVDNNNHATRATIGSFDLSANQGNVAYGNGGIGIVGIDGVDIVGNVSYDNVLSGIYTANSVLAQWNVTYQNEYGIHARQGSTIQENRSYGNRTAGIRGYRDPQIRRNVVYSSPEGIWFPDFAFSGYTNNTTIENNVVYDTSNRAVYIVEARPTIHSNTFYLPEGAGIVIGSSSANINLRDNIFSMGTGSAIEIPSSGQQGFTSDYNLFDLTGTGTVGVWQGVVQTDLVQWASTTFHDLTSLEADPLYVATTGVDSILGYESGLSDGYDDDFHLQSTAGRTTTSFAPVLDAVTGLPVFAVGSEVTDAFLSPAIDRGNISSPFTNEPANNGGYINIGAFGNTALASKSPDEYILVVNPDGQESWVARQTFDIEWRSRIGYDRIVGAGGGTTPIDPNHLAVYEFNDLNDPFADLSGNNQTPTPVGGTTVGPPGHIEADSALILDGVDDHLQLPNGFADLSQGFTFSVWANAEEVGDYARFFDFGNGSSSDNIIVAREASTNNLRFWIFRGGSSTSIAAPDVLELDTWQLITATYDGTTMRLYVDGVEVATGSSSPPNVIERTANYIGRSNWNNDYFKGRLDQVEILDRPLTATEIETRFNAREQDLPRVQIEVIDQTTGTINLIAPDAPDTGIYTWAVPADFTPSDTYRVRVTSVLAPTISDTSNNDFSISAATSTYYVNIAGDSDFSDNEYTTAAGNDANDGLTAASPKASIRSVLDSYDIEPGDVILVDTGIYNLGANIPITTEDQGVTIRGAQLPGHASVVDRGNTSSGQYVFDLQQATDVTIENLTISGAHDGVHASSGSNSHNFTIRDSILTNNSNRGIYFLRDSDSDNIHIENNQFINTNFSVTIQDSNTVRVLNNYFDNSGIGVDLFTVTDALVEGNQLVRTIGNRIGTGIKARGETIVRNNVVDTGNIGVEAYGSNVLIEQNTLFNHSTGVLADDFAVVQNNELYGNLDALRARESFILNNEIYGNQRGGTLGERNSDGTIAQGNRVYGNTERGFYAGRNAQIIENTFYSNPIHVIGDDTWFDQGDFDGLIRGNLFYDYSDTAILIDEANYENSLLFRPRIHNNTFYQDATATLAQAIRITDQAASVDVSSNIFYAEAGTIFNIDPVPFQEFTSDFNLFHILPGATVAQLGDAVVEDAPSWIFEVGFDRNARIGDPQFVDPLGADGLLGYDATLGIDHGSDADFHVALGSPAIDGGSPSFDFSLEPQLNGGRINMGAYGNTVEATVSQLVSGIQVYQPDGQSSFVSGQTLEALWTSNGFSPLTNADEAYRQAVEALNPILYYRFNEPDATVAIDRSASGYDGSYIGNAVPGGEGFAGLGTDPGTTFDESGDYVRTPDFDYPSDFSVSFWFKTDEATGSSYQYLVSHGSIGSSNSFNILLNEISSSDASLRGILETAITDDVGNEKRLRINTDVIDDQWHHYMFTASQSEGLSVYLDGTLQDHDPAWSGGFNPSGDLYIGSRNDRNSSRYYGGEMDEFAIHGTPLSSTDLVGLYGSSLQAIDIELIDATTGLVAQTVVTNHPNVGSFEWMIPQGVGLDGDYQIRVRGANEPAIEGESSPFSISSGGRTFYVNLADDTDFTDNEYTSAAGLNSNTGLSPDAPVASLPVLLARYGMTAGDTVLIDTGIYTLPQTAQINASHSGVTIRGAQLAGNETRFSLANAGPGSSVIEFDNADNITLENLVFDSGSFGIYAADQSDSDNVTFQNLLFEQLTGPGDGAGIWFGLGNDNTQVIDSTFDLVSKDGIALFGDNARVTGNSLLSTSAEFLGDGIRIKGHEALVSGNTVSNAAGYGISVSSPFDAIGSIVTGNQVTDSSRGYGLFGEVLATLNHAEGNTVGIEGTRAIVQENTVHANTTGIQSIELTSLTVLDNVLAANRVDGIIVGRGSVVTGNQIYSGMNGIVTRPGFFGQVENNLIYDHEEHALEISGAGNGDIYYQIYEREFRNGNIGLIDALSPVQTGTTEAGIETSIFYRPDNIAATWIASIDVPTAGEWTFYLRSADGSRIYIDGELVVMNDGIKTTSVERSASATLSAGRHDFRVDLFNDLGSPELILEWEGPGVARELMPLEAFSSSFSEVATFANNTVVHPNGVAIDVSNSTRQVVFENNIVEVQSGVVYSVSDDSQDGFQSDYNTLVGPVADWGGVSLVTLEAWQQALGQDIRSDALNPQFVDPDGTDNQLGATSTLVSTLAGQMSYRVHYGSFQQVSDFLNNEEPGLAGVSTTGFDTSVSGVTRDYGMVWDGILDIPEAGDWTFSTSSDDGSVLWINGQQVVDNDGLHGSQTRSGTINLPAGQHDIRVAYFQGGGGQHVSVNWQGPGVSNQRIPTSSISRGLFAVNDNGSDDNFLLQANSPAIDGANPATPIGFEPLPNGGIANRGFYGTTVEATTSSDALLRVTSPNAYELVQADLGLPVRWAHTGLLGSVDIELLDHDTEAVVATIATGVADTGAYDWIVDPLLAGETSYRVRVTSSASGLSDTSDLPFKIVPSTNAYYINIDGDSDLTDNEYTTAAGSNFNTGTTPDAPLASLEKLLRTYTLDPGDVIFVDTGHYTMVDAAVIDERHHGITVVGPETEGREALFDRGNTTAGQWGIELAGADLVTLRSLAVTNALIGIYAADNAGSDDLTATNMRVFNNGQASQEGTGIWIGAGNDRAEVVDSHIESNVGYGIYFAGDSPRVVDNTLVGTHERGIVIERLANNAVVSGNSIDGVTLEGVLLDTGTTGHEVRENILTNSGTYGIYSVAAASVIVQNDVTGGTTAGIYASNRDGDTAVVVDANTVTGAEVGIEIDEYATASGNTIYGNTTGIRGNTSQEEILITGNEVYLNTDGIVVGNSRATSTSVASNAALLVSSNTVYANASAGIRASQRAEVTGNRAYSNRVGIETFVAFRDFYGRITSNLVYDNTDNGILVRRADIVSPHTPSVINNTVYQIAGDALRVEDSSEDLVIANNILWVEAGYDLFVASGSTANIRSNYNLFQQGNDPSAQAVFFDGVAYPTLADWQAAQGQDANSLEGDPLFADIDGADNVFGYIATGNGENGGPDDNFFLTGGSPAIDSGDDRLEVRFDIDGFSRLDDPGTQNTGNIGYVPAVDNQDNGVFGPAYFGVAQGWQADDQAWELVFENGFTFSFFDVVYDRVFVSSNGLLQFGNAVNAESANNSATDLDTAVRIAPLWDDLRTDGFEDDIYVDTSQSDRVAIRWDATNKADNSDVEATVVLFADGSVKIGYGPGNSNLTPTVGFSDGAGAGATLLQHDGQTDLSRATPIDLIPHIGQPVDQWATSVVDFSSQFSTGSWSANQVLGEPNTFSYGDISTAWAAAGANNPTEYIQVSYDTPVYASGVTVRETNASGFVTQIDLVDTNGVRHNVWSGVDPSPVGSIADFRVDFLTTDFLVSGVYVETNGQHTTTWEEIDAIQLHGTTSLSGATTYVGQESVEETLYPTIVGQPIDMRSDNAFRLHVFPAGFSFPFYDEERTSVYISTNGFLQFDTNAFSNDSSNSTSELDDYPRIAPLWDDLRTDRSGDDVYVDESVPGQITFLWDGVLDTTEQQVRFATTLFANGDIRYDYGPGNNSLTATVGLSKGDPSNTLITDYNGVSSLDDAQSFVFPLGNGIQDLGAFEFRGSSLDVTPPTTVGAVPAIVDEGGITNQSVGQIQLIFSEPLNPIDAQATANYEFREAGINRILGDGDDVILPVLPTYSAIDRTVSLSVVGASIDDGLYQLTVYGQNDRGVRDLAGLVIDGDRNGTAGGDYVRVFEIDTAAPIPTVDTLATNDRTPDLSGTVDDPNAEIFVRLSSRNYIGVNHGDGTWTLSGSEILSNLGDGVYNVEVTARDSAGNIGADQTSNELTIDATEPVVTFVGFTTSTASPELTGTIDDPTASVSVNVNGSDYLATVDSGTWSLAAGVIDPPLPNADYTVTVTATDTFSNVGLATDLLTIAPDDTVSPTIVDVLVGSTAWSSDFGDYLAAAGVGSRGFYSLGGESLPSDILAWINIDQIQIEFSEDVQVEQTDLHLSGVAIGSYAGRVTGFSYDPTSYTATYELSEPLGAEKLLAEIAAGSVSDLRGNLLENNFQKSFSVLPGDTTRDGVVLGSDMYQVRSRQFNHAMQPAPTPDYSHYHDLDGNAVILGSDVGLARLRQFTTLPAGDPTSALPIAASAPGNEPLSLASFATPMLSNAIYGAMVGPLQSNEIGSQAVAEPLPVASFATSPQLAAATAPTLSRETQSPALTIEQLFAEYGPATGQENDILDQQIIGPEEADEEDELELILDAAFGEEA